MNWKQLIRQRANNARLPWHHALIAITPDELGIAVQGTDDSTAAHADTRPALRRLADAIGITAEEYSTGNFLHSGTYASVWLPLPKALAQIETAKQEKP
jgi:hypothetical protein